MKRLIAVAALLAFAFGLIAQASAQQWPNRSIRIIVPYAVGGNTDSVARITALKLQGALGQSVVVENRAGAGGRIAMDLVAKSAPDGYTLLMAATGPQAVSPAFEKVSYDPIKDFVFISNVTSNPLVMMVPPGLPANNIKEFIALAKSKTGTLNFGTGGVAGMTHLAGELFAHMAGIKFTQVHYKGGAPSITAILGGQVDVVFANYSDAIPQIKAGKLKALGISSAKRAPQTPDVPTIAEAGLPGYEAEGWNGLVAPAGTPPAIVNRLARIVQEMTRDPDYQKRFDDIGSTPIGDTPEQYRAFIVRQVAFWEKFFKDTGMQLPN